MYKHNISEKYVKLWVETQRFPSTLSLREELESFRGFEKEEEEEEEEKNVKE